MHHCLINKPVHFCCNKPGNFEDMLVYHNFHTPWPDLKLMEEVIKLLVHDREAL
jgi:hypothetical protein